jgi:hypothetical protein
MNSFCVLAEAAKAYSLDSSASLLASALASNGAPSTFRGRLVAESGQVSPSNGVNYSASPSRQTRSSS